METIDSENKYLKPQELWTIRLFLVSFLFTILTTLLSSYAGDFGIPYTFQKLLLPNLFFITMALGFTGFIVGFFELKKNKRQALSGIIGNLIVLLFHGFMIAVLTGISQIKQT